MADGRLAAVASALNPQAAYGADVITRINYASAESGGAEEMRECALREINLMLSRLAGQCGAEPGDIYSVYVTGNTTMLHLFMGLPAAKIAVAPFIPVTTGMCLMSRRESGLLMSESGVAVCLPGVSAYVGADTLAAVLACGMDASDDMNVLIDIGTNGEIVVGGRGDLYACSTAAGPAFEGASISCGVGGVEGAVDSVQFGADGAVTLTTIGGAPAIGICGSGLVDAVAQMLRHKIIDETGRLLEADEAEDEGAPRALCDRLVTLGDGARAFMLAPAGDMQIGIYITQRDVREIQNAKAAIAAGIQTLLKKAGLGAGDIGRLYLAGGFGNYIRVQSALDIGLILRDFEGRITPAGNAAGAGASAALLSTEAVGRLTEMSRKVKYIELSASPDFTNAYIECMTFE
ncbi:MAG: ASKHA domain-containing protein [Oscillospiraceae bacterium]|nr:ASKHA domain-containing protein [Oscillospiraceae bacterium]